MTFEEFWYRECDLDFESHINEIEAKEVWNAAQKAAKKETAERCLEIYHEADKLVEIPVNIKKEFLGDEE